MKSNKGYLNNDTIAAVITAMGGPVGVVRISGPLAFSSVASLLSPSARLPFSSWRGHELHLVKLYANDGSIIDEVLLAKFISPASYTGEDCVELHFHGNPLIITRAFEALAASSVRQALPGEFSFRAVRNGKLTLSQAQAVSDLIAAGSETAATIALEKLEGSQNHLLSGIAVELRKIATLAEAGIDFSDQDEDHTSEISLPSLRKSVEKVTTPLRLLANSFERGNKIQSGVRVAFIGLPNVGKSTLFNALLGEDRSIVSEIAGTTRDVIREELHLKADYGTILLRLEDTAGLRATDDSVETQGIARTQRVAKAADLIFYLVDANSPDLFDLAREQWIGLNTSPTKVIGIFTKSDLLSSNQGPSKEDLIARFSSFGISRWVFTSAHTSVGIHDTVQAITEYCKKWFARTRGEVLLTRQDQLSTITETLVHLDRAAEAPAHDLFAADIQQALSTLSPLIGETLPDDILGAIFSTFCIGK